jgi:hypothetical protein
MTELSRSDLAVLLGHVGYGNPRGQLWFLGMEERLLGDPQVNLRWRVENLQHPVATVTQLMKAPWPRVGKSPAWVTMAKIARFLIDKADDWQSLEKGREYVRTRLGTADGDTLLLEVFPLPTVTSSDRAAWPYAHWYPSRAAYEDAVWPARRALIRGWVDEYRPPLLFWYGKKNWKRYLDLFDLPVDIARSSGTAIGSYTATTVVLTPFFAPYAFGHEQIRRLRDLLPTRFDATSNERR